MENTTSELKVPFKAEKCFISWRMIFFFFLRGVLGSPVLFLAFEAAV